MSESAEPNQEINWENGKQILKAREDREPITLRLQNEDSETSPLFIIDNKSNGNCNWADDKNEISLDELRKRIEPWLTALCQSEQLSLLIGSGLSRAVHKIATDKDIVTMDDTEGFENNKYEERIIKEAKRVSEAAGRGKENTEDIIRVANELIRGLEILSVNSAVCSENVSMLKQSLAIKIKNFTRSIQKIEQGIAEAESAESVEGAESVVSREDAFNYLVNFLMSFASRSGVRDRLHIFTTNYDRVIEAGADVAGLHLLDRFVGALTPVFRSSRLDLDIHYNPPGIRGEPRYLEGVARFTKLHGSIDWIDANGSIRRIAHPFGAEELDPYMSLPISENADARRLMIYPNAAKDRETSGYPYVELFRDLAAACCRPNHTIFTYGYSFGDEHINRVLEDMLTIPSTHLVAIAYDDSSHRIMKFYENIGRPSQISLMIGNRLADLKKLVDWFLPKPSIDRTTYRMVELLKARHGTSQSEDSNNSSVELLKARHGTSQSEDSNNSPIESDMVEPESE